MGDAEHAAILIAKLCNVRRTLNGNCLQSSLIYQATVTCKNNRTTETYIKLTKNDFKTRYRNHTASFQHTKHRNSTHLSKHIWTLKHWLTKKSRRCILHVHFLSNYSSISLEQTRGSSATLLLVHCINKQRAPSIYSTF